MMSLFSMWYITYCFYQAEWEIALLFLKEQLETEWK